MVFSSTVIDGKRQTSDVTLPDGRFVVITIPLCIFENAGSTQVHFGKLNTTNVKRSHYAKLIQYAFDVEVVRRITRECPTAVEKVYLQRRGDYIVLFVVFSQGTAAAAAAVVSEMMNSHTAKMTGVGGGDADGTKPKYKKPRNGDKDQLETPALISAHQAVLLLPNGAANVDTVCFPAALFNKTPDKISNYALLVTCPDDISKLFNMTYIDAGLEPIAGGGGEAGGGGATGGGEAGGSGAAGGGAAGGGDEASDDDAAVHGGLGGIGRGGAGRDNDFDEDTGAGDDGGRGGDGGEHFQERVRYRVPAPGASGEEEEGSDGAGPASVEMNVKLAWLELHSLDNPALKYLGVVDDALVNTRTILANGAEPLYVVDSTYHMFRSFYQSIEPCGDLLKQYEIYARVRVEQETRGQEQNPPGDLSILNMFRHSECGRKFLDIAPSVDKMREFSKMAFSRISTSDGLPDAVTDMMRDVNDLYRQRAGVLYSTSASTEAEVEGPAILKYCNVSPVANVCLFLMDTSELQDATSLHLVDLMLTMSMLSTGFRPGVTKKNGAFVPDDMPLHILLGGGPGIGKSHAHGRTKTLFPLVCKSSSLAHSSKLADTGVQATDDQSDYAPEIQDEAKNQILGADEHKMSPDDKDKLNLTKTKMSGGELVTKRLQPGNEPGDGMKPVLTTAKVYHKPYIANTNVYISCNDPNASQNRLCVFYPFALPRMYENTSRTLANKSLSEKKINKRTDAISHAYMVFFMLGKLQELGILPWPDTSVLNAFMHDFETIAKENPFLACRMFNSSSREYGFVRVAYIHLMNFCLVMAFFVDPKGKHTNKRFDIAQLLDLAPYMYVGDPQAAIFALGFKAHELINPFICEVRSRIVRRAAAPPVPRFTMTDDSPAELKVNVDPAYTELRDSAYQKLENVDNGFKEKLANYYVFICEFPFENKGFNITFSDYSEAMSHILESAETTRKMRTKDIKMVLTDLQNMTPSYGKDQGLRYLVVKPTENRQGLFALKSWILEELKQEWTFKAMVEKALLANRYTPDGRYLVPELLEVGAWKTKAPKPENPTVAALFSETNEQAQDRYVPSALAFVDVPKHSPTCPLGADDDAPFEATTARWRRTLESIEAEVSKPTCTCFRKTGKATICGNEKFKCSVETMAQMLNLDIRNKQKDVLVGLYDVKPPRSFGALGSAVYPDNLIEEILGASTGSMNVFKPSDEVVERVHDDAVLMDAELAVAELEE